MAHICACLLYKYYIHIKNKISKKKKKVFLIVFRSSSSHMIRGRFHEKSQTEPDSRLSQGLKSETFVSAEFLAQMDFTKGGSAETSLKLWSQLFNLISYI